MSECTAISCGGRRNKLGSNSSMSRHIRGCTVLTKSNSRLPIDEDDVALIFEDLYQGRSVVPPHDVPSRPTLARWDYTQPLAVDNCVVFEFKDAEKHAVTCLAAKSPSAPVQLWGKGVEEIVKRRSAEARRVMNWALHN